jgi:histidinol-phosphatase
VTDWSHDLHLALRLADEADIISLNGFRKSGLVVQTKPDMTPVTEADQAVESRLRELIEDQRPDDGILGEEFGDVETTVGTRRWVIDPIDGTKNYVRGVPAWATLIALESTEDDGTHTRVGVISAPALGMRWWASRDGGAWKSDPASREPRRIRVSGVQHLTDAMLSYSELAEWTKAGKRDQFINLTEVVWRTRAYGDFWSHLMVAEGVVDIASEPELSRWDMAAIQVVVEEAGGRFTDLSGQRGCDGGNALVTNGLLHESVLDLLSS